MIKQENNNDIIIDNLQYKRLDFNKIKNITNENISSEEALKDIVPIQWSEDILSGKKKVIIKK